MAYHNFQRRVLSWVLATFGETSEDKTIPRAHRFLEEALELCQVAGVTQAEAHELVEYTFNRPMGWKSEEIGGALVTLAALSNTLGYDMEQCGEDELAKNWTRMEKIRAKAASKIKGSPLPGVAAE